MYCCHCGWFMKSKWILKNSKKLGIFHSIFFAEFGTCVGYRSVNICDGISTNRCDATNYKMLILKNNLLISNKLYISIQFKQMQDTIRVDFVKKNTMACTCWRHIKLQAMVSKSNTDNFCNVEIPILKNRCLDANFIFSKIVFFCCRQCLSNLSMLIELEYFDKNTANVIIWYDQLVFKWLHRNKLRALVI